MQELAHTGVVALRAWCGAKTVEVRVLTVRQQERDGGCPIPDELLTLGGVAGRG